MKKKISLMIVVILIMQVLLPMLTVIWESDFTLISKAVTSGEYEYVINEDEQTITITKYKGTDENVIVPSSIDGYTVTGFGNGTFTHTNYNKYSIFVYSNCINSVKLPSTMKKIGGMAFDGCNNLTNIELNNGLEEIGNQAFISCNKLKKIEIPSSVKKIICNLNFNPFDEGCDLLEEIIVDSNNEYYSSEDGVLFNKQKTILISYPNSKKDKIYDVPATIETIYACSFKNPYLEKISIPETTTNLEKGGFISRHTNTFAINECKNLKEIIVDGNNEYYSSEDGVLFNKGKTELLVYPLDKTETFYIIPNMVKTCNDINNPYLENIRVNSIISDIDFLRNIPNLKNIEIDSNNPNYSQENGILLSKDKKEIIYYPRGKEEEKYEIGNNINKIAARAFENSNLKEIILSNNITSIERKTFYNCINLTNITIPETVNRIDIYAFGNCENITDITIPNGVTEITQDTFSGCINLKNIIIPEGVTKIGINAFANCSSISNIALPSTLKEIEANAFENCINLEEIDIPEGVTSIGGYICYKTDKLKKITIPSTFNRRNIKLFFYEGYYRFSANNYNKWESEIFWNLAI